MIKARIVEEEKRVYVDVSGYITSNEAKKFLMEYKQIIKGIRRMHYKLVVTTSVFECENSSDLKNVCMTFYKAGYKKMYLVDPNNYIMNTMSLGPIEKKMFFKAVAVVPKKEDIK